MASGMTIAGLLIRAFMRVPPVSPCRVTSGSVWYVICYDGSPTEECDRGRARVARGASSRRTAAHLRAVAYRMLGSLSEADDAVQESWLRLSRTDTGEVENLGAWLTTVVGRVCLDMLRSRRSRREDPLDATCPTRS